MKPLSECRLYGFVDTAYLHGRNPAAVARMLCEGGVDLIQLRAKESTPDEIRRMAETILPVTDAARIGLVINDHPDVAREVGAELCHLGQEDFFQSGYSHCSQLSGVANNLQIGLSTHSPDQAVSAVGAAPDYIAIGPVYATATKPQARPVTLDYVKWATANVQIPWFAIGGITLQNLEEVLAAGAQRVCVVSAILNASDVTAACREFRRKLDEI